MFPKDKAIDPYKLMLNEEKPEFYSPEVRNQIKQWNEEEDKKEAQFNKLSGYEDFLKMKEDE